MLLRANIERLHAGQPISDLPQTFENAICIARRFSIRYLWIDRLYITQDSIKDWTTEAATMGKVYASSLCNILATVSADPSEGLFRRRIPANTIPAVISQTTAGSTLATGKSKFSIRIYCHAARFYRSEFSRLGFFILQRKRSSGNASCNKSPKDCH